MWTITTKYTIYDYCIQWDIWKFNPEFLYIERNIVGTEKYLILPLKDILSIEQC